MQKGQMTIQEMKRRGMMTDDGRYKGIITSGHRMRIPAELVKLIHFEVGDNVTFELKRSTNHHPELIVRKSRPMRKMLIATKSKTVTTTTTTASPVKKNNQVSHHRPATPAMTAAPGA